MGVSRPNRHLIDRPARRRRHRDPTKGNIGDVRIAGNDTPGPVGTQVEVATHSRSPRNRHRDIAALKSLKEPSNTSRPVRPRLSGRRNKCTLETIPEHHGDSEGEEEKVVGGADTTEPLMADRTRSAGAPVFRLGNRHRREYEIQAGSQRTGGRVTAHTNSSHCL